MSRVKYRPLGEPVAILVVGAGLIVRLGCDGVSLIPLKLYCPMQYKEEMTSELSNISENKGNC